MSEISNLRQRFIDTFDILKNINGCIEMIFAKLIETSTCRNLLNLYFWRERARSLTLQSRANSADSEVEKSQCHNKAKSTLLTLSS